MTGTVTISIELELAWGQHDKGGSDIYSDDRSIEEQYFERLLETCDRYNLPMTFDVVGHLLLNSCAGTHDGGHETGWFNADPGTDAETDPLYYWPALTKCIRERTTEHELATHTFSHVLSDEIEDETLAWELKRCRSLHEFKGFPAPKTMVTPRHRTVDPAVLRTAGIEGVRTVKKRPRESTIGRYGQRAIFWTIDRGHPTYTPEVHGGVVELYTTPYPSLTAGHLPNGRSAPLTPFGLVPLSVRQRIHRSYLFDAITNAIETDSNAHLWTHLYNMANQSQWSSIKSFLERLGEVRENGAVEVLTMAELSERYSHA